MANVSKTTEDGPYMPRPLCRICLGDEPKLRAIGGGHDMICDACWEAAFADKGCNGNE